MTDFRTAAGIGARIQAARKQRGMRHAHDLADAIPGGSLSEAMIQNIEAGRKENLTVTQLLNIAYALKIAPGLLLAPMGKPNELLDLPGLSDDLSQLTVVEFDAWLSGLHGGTHSWSSSEDQSERAQLEAMRELEVQLRERDRLRAALEVERSSELSAEDVEELQRWDTTEERLAQAERTVQRLSTFLTSAGWNASSLSE
jgi:transcriptional regulator with XRE-family HTH domain